MLKHDHKKQCLSHHTNEIIMGANFAVTLDGYASQEQAFTF